MSDAQLQVLYFVGGVLVVLLILFWVEERNYRRKK